MLYISLVFVLWVFYKGKFYVEMGGGIEYNVEQYTRKQEIFEVRECKVLLFDLDGTLLRSDKTISQATLKALRKCKGKGILIDVSTSRGEQNAISFIEELQPDVLVTSGGASVKYNGEYIYGDEFSGGETEQIWQ